MSKRNFFLITIILIMSGCNNKLSNVFNRDASALKVNEVSFNYFSGKIKVDYDGEKRISGIANLRMRKDSLIWISLSPGLGLEVARIMITHDSISVLDKFNKKYTVMNYEKLSEKFNFDIDYPLVEAVLLGNLISPYSKNKIKKSEGRYTYEQQESNYFFKNFIGMESMKLERLEVQDTVSKSSIYVNYGDFQTVEDQVLPFEINAKLLKGQYGSSTTKVDLEYNKAEFTDEALRFPFSIPSKYERKEVN